MRSSSSDQFLNDNENIHLATWTKDEIYESLLINKKSEGKYSQMLTYNVVVKKLTYEERDLKGVTVKIYQKSQALINYLIDTFSREGYWFLDLFLGLGQIADITYGNIFSSFIVFFIIHFFKVCFFMLFVLTIFFAFGD